MIYVLAIGAVLAGLFGAVQWIEHRAVAGAEQERLIAGMQAQKRAREAADEAMVAAAAEHATTVARAAARIATLEAEAAKPKPAPIDETCKPGCRLE